MFVSSFKKSTYEVQRKQRKQRKEGKPNTLLPRPLALPLLLLSCLLSPAHMHLHRFEGVGRHNPRCHSEHDFVCENGRLWDVLSTRETLGFYSFFSLSIYHSDNMTYNVYTKKKKKEFI